MKIIKSVIACAIFILVLMPYHNGDINHDGKVTVTDLVQLRQMVEGLREKSPFADLNYDGLVNELDLNILRHKLAQDTVKQKYKAKEKVKALTQAERLDRIEELLGLKGVQ